MIPDYQTLMLPVLKSCADGEVSNKEVLEKICDDFGLSLDERQKLLPSGKTTIINNRMNWAKSYLKQAGLVTYPARSRFIITGEGKDVLSSNPDRIDVKFLEKFESFIEFRNRRSEGNNESPENEAQTITEENATPDEILRSAHSEINDALASDLLSRVRSSSPLFFEELIVELLMSMGYGGTSEEAGRAMGQTGDDGVDGVIDQDPLGVDQIYVQAKRYKEGSNVGSGAIRDFFGALNLKRAQKGIFFTTSKFTSDAIRTAHDLGTRIVLIDGLRLAKLMIQYNVGCREEEVLYLKKVDEDFFE